MTDRQLGGDGEIPATSDTTIAGDESVSRQDREPLWAGPGRFGQPEASSALFGVSAPLLAGFSLSLLGVVAQAPTSFRWPGLAMATLLTAAVGLVLSLQLGINARGHLYSQADVAAWGRLNNLEPIAEEALRAFVQRRDMNVWRRLSGLGTSCYNASIVLLALAVAFVAAPPDGYGDHSLMRAEQGWRWVGYGIGVLAAVAELAWIIYDAVGVRKGRTLDQHSTDALPEVGVGQQ